MKKYLAECIGTCTLVVLGCGTAMLVGCDAAAGGGYVLTALAFGLSIVAMAYSIGNISGCHINPAVSLGVLLSGGMSTKDFWGYVVSQCVGALIGSALLALIFKLGGVTDMTGGLGTNGLSGVGGNAFAGLLVEIVLTFIFVTCILGVTSSKASHGSFGGHRPDPHGRAHPRHRPDRNLGQSRTQLRSCADRCILRKCSTSLLPLGLYRWAACRCSTCRRCVQSTGELILMKSDNSRVFYEPDMLCWQRTGLFRFSFKQISRACSFEQALSL